MRLNASYFNVNCHHAAPAGQNVPLSSEISQHVLGELVPNDAQTSAVLR